MTWQGSRTELTDRILIFGERHLRAVLAPFGAHSTAGDHIERLAFSRHDDPIIPLRILTIDGSGADRSSAV
jgi:hypothetical protein